MGEKNKRSKKKTPIKTVHPFPSVQTMQCFVKSQSICLC